MLQQYGTVAPVWDQDYYLDKVYFPPTYVPDARWLRRVPEQ